jgi:hypothetical protein
MLNITIDTKELTRLADRAALLTEKNIRYAVAKAMTDSAKDAQARLKAETPRFVDRPTPWTLNGTYVRSAGPNRLTAEVGFKQDAYKGSPAGKYLNPMARGGDRSSTRVEGVLRSGGVIKPNQFIVPTPAFRGDPFGNVPRGILTRMLSQTKAFTGPLASKNASDSARSKRKRAKTGAFFAIYTKELGEGPKGIFYRAPGAKSFELAFGVLDDAPNYERTFPIQRILNDEYAKAYARNIQTSLTKELQRALGR